MRVWGAFSRLITGSGRLAALSLVLSVAQSLALVPIALLVRRAFDHAIPSDDTGELLLLGAAILGLYLLSLGLGLIGRYVVLNVTKPAVARVRSELIDHVIWLPRSFYDVTDTGRLHSLIVQDTERLDTMAKYLLAIVIPSLGTAAILIASLAIIEPLLFAVLVVTLPLLVLVARLLRDVLKRRVRAWQESSDAFSALALATLRSATLIKLRTAEEEAIAANAAQAADLGVAGQRVGWVQQAYGLSQIALGGVAGVVVLIGGGVSVANGSMSLGDLIAFMAVLAMARGQLNWVVAALPDVLTGLAAIERIDDVLENTEHEPYRGTRPIDVKGAVAWEEVTFGYSREEPPVLLDVSLAVETGERVAILGPTGAGKTTLMLLLLGLYRPWSGRITVEGAPLAEIDVRALRRQAGALLQDGATMRGSVAENIAFGRPQASQAEIDRAAALATVEEFVADLPRGYQTNIGDDGVRLSAGQRQRIALARALLGGPPLLMLDEPTSHLDPATADRVLDNLGALDPRPTLLLVTHDPLVAQRADRLVEVRGGRLDSAAASLLERGA
jgi:ABC-type bacteriocin/lantibiotic exporter with double-glycine peptidase domain